MINKIYGFFFKYKSIFYKNKMFTTQSASDN